MSWLPSSMRRWAPIALTVVVLDQLTKWWAVNTLDTRDIDIVWTLRLHLSFNSGMAFSQGEGFGPIIGVVALVVIVVLVVGLRRETNPLTDVAVGLIVGGAIGNVIDRLFRSPAPLPTGERPPDKFMGGAVIDFVYTNFWATFNVADVLITFGLVFIVIDMFIPRRAAAPQPASSETST